MLKLNIKKHCNLRNYPDTAAFLRKQGFSHWLSNKYSSETIDSISPDDLERLCRIFRCTPNDLFEWTPKDANEDTSDNPLAALKADEPLDMQLKNINYTKLKEIAKSMSEK